MLRKWFDALAKTTCSFVCAAHAHLKCAALLASDTCRFRQRLKPFTQSSLRGARRATRQSIIFIILLVAVVPAHAADQTATLKRVESYLNSITTMTAKFNQIDPEGALTSGKMFLKRPGKMRWQYNPPTPVLMVSSGDQLTYYDYELDQLNQIPLDDSLAGFLARPKIKLTDKSLKISNVIAQANAIRLTITQVNKPDEGTLTLELSDNPLKINNFIISDANDRSTSVQLQGARFGDPIADELFVFDNPRKNRARKYRK